MKRVVLSALLLLLAGGAWGQPVSGMVSVNGRNVPLPPGDWQRVADVSTARNMAGGGGVQGRNQQVALLRASGGRVTGLIVIGTNIDISDQMAGWGRERECARSDIHASRVEIDVPRSQDCWTLNHIVMTRGPNASDLVNRYYEAARAAGGMPPTMLRVISRRADNINYIAVSYYFAPDPERFAPATEGWGVNPWHRDRLDAARSAYVAALRNWAPIAHAGVSRGFRGTAVTPLPEP